MQSIALVWSVILSLSVNLCLLGAAPKKPPVRRREWNGGTSVSSNRTLVITKVQVEDLDSAMSTGCVPLRELNFCGGSSRTARYPNALGHTSEKEAKISVKGLASLLADPLCRPFLESFLCVALTPSCSTSGDDDTPAALPPCRSLCSAAVDHCSRTMTARLVSWPSTWTCDRFPVEGLCFNKPFTSSAETSALSDGRVSSTQWLLTSVIQSKGSLEPPPSSAVYDELLAASTYKASDSEGLTSPLLEQSGDPKLFRGWADVQGLGKANDYCRVLGKTPGDRFLSCALNGTGDDLSYISRPGFDVGMSRTWFMRDMDADGRDDYCRCVGNGKRSQLICMKAGGNGFYGGVNQPGSEYTFRLPESASQTLSCLYRDKDFLTVRRRPLNGLV